MIVSSDLLMDVLAFCFLILVFGIIIFVESPKFKERVLFIMLTTMAAVILFIISIAIVNLVSWFFG